jgi:hypothetical protein
MNQLLNLLLKIVLSLFGQKLIFAAFSISFLSRSGEPLPSANDLMTAIFVLFWDHALSWQGGGFPVFILLTLTSICFSYGKISRYIYVASIALFIIYFVYMIYYVSTVTFAGTPIFWEQIAWRLSALALATALCFALDFLLSKYEKIPKQ